MAKRIIVFLVGVFCVGLGISMITKSGLGTSAVTSLSYVLSFILPISLGTFVFSVNMCMVIAQIMILRKQFQMRMLWQIPAALVFASSIDLFMFLLSPVSPNVYWQRLVILLAGCVIFGLGVALEVAADVIILPAEAICVVISRVYRINFGTVKTALDVSMVAAAVLLSLIFLGGIEGVREGTVITALIVGSISRFFLRGTTKLAKH